jgi:subtilase family serine protease
MLHKGEIVIRKLSVSLLTLAALLAAVNVVCQAQSQTLLTRHVRKAVLNGEAKLVGRLPANQTVHFDIVLALHHQPDLENFLREVYDPSSPTYRHFLTPSEFTARFGPSQGEYDALIGFAKASGFTVIHGSRKGFDVQLTGSVAKLEKAFHVTMGVYQHPTENRTFYAVDREPTVNLPFQLWHITGLDTYSIPRPLYVRKDPKAKSQAAQAHTGSCPSASFCGSDMRAAYYEGTVLTGSGQNLALLELAGTDLTDLTTYYSGAGQPEPFVPTLLSTGGFTTSCLNSDGCDDTEQTLDMTQEMGMAPGATMLYMYVCGNAYGTGEFSETDCFSSMVSDEQAPLSLQISSSWIWSPEPGTDDPYFMTMAAQGQSFFEASGDSGGYTESAPWPSNSAYVISVGGTSLTTTGPAGDWASETYWSYEGGAYGGGGWGSNVDIPSWQVTAAGDCSTEGGECSETYRDVPDVSANAQFSFYVCANQSGLTGCTANDYGGTSFAAPMWAGFLALVNQQAATNGVAAPGFINPTIYPLNLGNGDADFHDITANGGASTFPCVAGFNMCAGWGSPNGAALIDALAGPAGPNFSLSASPSSLSITQGNSGTSTISVTDLDGFSGSVSLSASGLPNGVTASFNPTSTSTTSVLTLTVGAQATPGTATVKITGQSGTLTNSTNLSLTVNPTSPVVTLNPTSLTWNKEVVGETSGKSVTVTNTGGSTLTGISISTSGAPFGLTTGAKACGSTLAAGSSCVIRVTFSPTALGLVTGTLTINDSDGNQQVPLTGTGSVPVKLSPASAKFGKVTVGTSSAAKTFTLTNEQTKLLTGVTITTTGNFTVSSTNCSTNLGATSSCTIEVVFTPTQTGAATGTLQVNDNAAYSPEISTLSGTGK